MGQRLRRPRQKQGGKVNRASPSNQEGEEEEGEVGAGHTKSGVDRHGHKKVKCHAY